MRTLKVEVTLDDISRGDPGDPCWCPIALALRRVGVERPHVDEVEISGDIEGRRFKVLCSDLPARVWCFIDAFDSYDPETEEDVYPIGFELELPEAAGNA